MKKLMDTPELAEYFGVAKHTIYVWRNEGMPTVKIGRYYRYDLEKVLKWLEERSA